MTKKHKTHAHAPTLKEAAPEPETGTVTLKYVGPAGETSALFGALTVGAHYHTDGVFAMYLVAHHPSHWTRVKKSEEGEP